ncbi:MAG: DUF1559 domain-containing protein [Planctomycetia bacterium]|nr:DUF1559 domain-containing protein [Planctomycetia bacterium]
MKWVLQIIAIVLLGTSLAWGDGLPRGAKPFVTKETSFVVKMNLNDWNIDDLYNQLAENFQNIAAISGENERALADMQQAEFLLASIAEKIDALNELGVGSVVLVFEFREESSAPTLAVVFPCEERSEDVLEILDELAEELAEDADLSDKEQIKSGRTDDAVCWIFAESTEDESFESLCETFEPAERPDLEAGLERVQECRLCVVGSFANLPNFSPESFEDAPEEVREIVGVLREDCRCFAVGAHLGEDLFDFNLISYLFFTNEDSAERALKFRENLVDAMAKSIPDEEAQPFFADYLRICSEPWAFEREGLVLEMNLNSNLELWVEKYFGWTRTYSEYCERNRVERAEFDRNAEADRLAERIKPWLKPDTIAVAHIDLERFNLGDMSEVVVSQLEEFLPRTFASNNLFVRDICKVEAFVEAFESKRAQLLEAGGKDIFIVFNSESVAYVIIPVETDNMRRLMRLRNLSMFPNLEQVPIASGYKDGTLLFLVAPFFFGSIDEEKQKEFIEEFYTHVQMNAAERPQFRDGFALGAGECFKVVFAMNPTMFPLLDGGLDEMERNGFTNPGTRVVSRGLEVVTFSLDPHTGVVSLQAFSRTESAAANLVKLSEIWKRDIIKNMRQNPSFALLAEHFEQLASLITLEKDGRRVSIRFNIPEGENGEASMRKILGTSGVMATAISARATQNARSSAHRMQMSNNLKNIALAMLNHESSFRHFPPPYSTDEEGKPLHSWRVLLLPYLGETALYQQIRLDEPWNSEWNSQFHDKCPEVFKDPRVPCAPSEAVVSVVVGEGTVFDPANKKGCMIGQIRDGTSNTILLVERTPVCWMDPLGDVKLEELKGGVESSPILIFDGVWQAGSCDGAVHCILSTIDSEVLLHLFLRSDRTPCSLHSHTLNP